MNRSILILGLIGCVGCAGCAGNQHLTRHSAPPAARPVTMVAAEEPKPRLDGRDIGPNSVTDDTGSFAGEPNAGTLTIDGRQYTVQLADAHRNEVNVVTAGHSLVAFQDSDALSAPVPETTTSPLPVDAGTSAMGHATAVDMNLPSVLAMVDSQHPAIGFARWRVQEAYAQLARAEVLWLPSIQAGFSFDRHDGNYQASDGTIVDVNRNSFQYGLGTGATGAGTTPRPGLVAQFHFADAIFQPKIAEKTAWARGHAASAVVNEELLTGASAYIELLRAHQDFRILEESRDRTSKLSKITGDFAVAGQGLQADADRMLTELSLVENRVVRARERIAIASARLAQALSMDGGSQIVPMDPTVVPIELVSVENDKPSLISTGLANRPELKESQALVAAACEAYRREKYAPFIPSALLGFSTGGFGGGLGNNLDNVDGRYDFDALMSWEVRNLGFGERAARRESCSRIQQAKFEKVRVMDQVAREVSESYSQVRFRREQINITQRAIASAQESYERNLARIRDGQGLPLEVLQSLQALESAQRAYLEAVIDHNQAQFRLQWALGWPVTAPSNGQTGM